MDQFGAYHTEQTDCKGCDQGGHGNIQWRMVHQIVTQGVAYSGQQGRDEDSLSRRIRDDGESDRGHSGKEAVCQ